MQNNITDKEHPRRRGVGYPVVLNIPPPTPDKELDEILDDFLGACTDEDYDAQQALEAKKTAFAEAKVAILEHYISRAEVLEITEPIYQAAFNRGERDPVYVAMVELRQKLGAK